MTNPKPQVVYFSQEPEMVDLVTVTLSEQFDVTPLTDVADIEGALAALQRLKPDYVIVDPNLPELDHQLLNLRIQEDETLQGIRILIIREDI